MAARFLTSVVWGMVADKYGRRPVMLIGVLSVFVLHLFFVFMFMPSSRTRNLRNFENLHASILS